MGIGQPRMKRKHRQLDSECQEEGGEHPHLRGGRKGLCRQLENVERVAALDMQREDTSEEKQASGQAVKDELQSCSNAIRPSP